MTYSSSAAVKTKMAMVIRCALSRVNVPQGGEEDHPGDERAKSCEREADTDSAEISRKQYRRQEGHRSEAFADSAEGPAQERRQDEEPTLRR